MAYLFDTDAISEAFRRRPLPAYMAWLDGVPRDEQFTSAVCLGELYQGAFRLSDPKWHLEQIEQRLLPRITVLPYDTAVARVFGETRADLEKRHMLLPDADVQIAATALRHGLVLVTGNVRHFQRVGGLRLETVLARSRAP